MMNKGVPWIIFAVALGFGGLATWCSWPREADGRPPSATHSPSTPPSIARLRVATHPTILGAPVTIAQDLPFYKDQSLDVEISYVASTKYSLPALVGGSVDMVLGSIAAGNFNILAEAGNVRIVADGGRVLPRLIIRRDLWGKNGIQSLAWLKGKRVRTTREGGPSHFALLKLLREAGLSQGSLKPIPIEGEQETLAALERHDLDAALMNEPEASTAIDLGVGVAYEGPEAKRAFPPSGQEWMLLYANAHMIERPDILRRFLGAYLKAVAAYNRASRNRNRNDPEVEAVINSISKYTKTPRDVVLKALWPTVPDDGTPDIAAISDMQKTYADLGLATERLDIGQALDLRFLK
jgi:ABC-type nitrate/sulfonate/bicarbonate transport system substrate-binding protein